MRYFHFIFDYGIIRFKYFLSPEIAVYRLNERLMPEELSGEVVTSVPNLLSTATDNSHILLSVPNKVLEAMSDQCNKIQTRRTAAEGSSSRPSRRGNSPTKSFSGKIAIDRLRKRLVPENSFALRFQPTARSVKRWK